MALYIKNPPTVDAVQVTESGVITDPETGKTYPFIKDDWVLTRPSGMKLVLKPDLFLKLFTRR